MSRGRSSAFFASNSSEVRIPASRSSAGFFSWSITSEPGVCRRWPRMTSAMRRAVGEAIGPNRSTDWGPPAVETVMLPSPALVSGTETEPARPPTSMPPGVTLPILPCSTALRASSARSRPNLPLPPALLSAKRPESWAADLDAARWAQPGCRHIGGRAPVPPTLVTQHPDSYPARSPSPSRPRRCAPAALRGPHLAASSCTGFPPPSCAPVSLATTRTRGKLGGSRGPAPAPMRKDGAD